jgi:HEAT repeat protein
MSQKPNQKGNSTMFKQNSLTLTVGLLATFAGLAFGQEPTPLLVKTADELVAVLKSDAPLKDKTDACRQLSVIGNKDAVKPLIDLLGDEKLSHMARYALETIPGPEVDQAMLNEFYRLKGKQLIGLVGSFGVRRTADAIPFLAGKLQSPDPVLIDASARALGQIGTLPAAKALQDAWANLPAPRYLLLSEGLMRCAEALVAKGLRNDALAIYDCLRQAQASHQVRAGALRGAILTRHEEGLPLLRESLVSQDFLLVDAAIRTSLEMPGIEVTRTLAGVLNDSLSSNYPLSANHQLMLVEALGKRGDSAGSWSVFMAAQRGVKAVRLAAIRALPEIADPAAVPVLVTLAGEDDSEIAPVAQESLAAFRCPEADAAVLKMLDSTRRSQRLTGIELVARRRMTSCLPSLLKAAGDEDEKIRPAALKRLGELAGPADLGALLDLLAAAKTSPDLSATEQAISAVCARASDPKDCTEKLTGALSQAEAGQKSALLRLLGSVGGADALKAVRAAVSDSNKEVHAAAVRALGSWKTADAANDLLELAKSADDPTEKLLCLRSYLGWAANADLPANQRFEMCQKAATLIQKTDEKRLYLGALSDIPTAESLALIAPYLDDSATKEEASAATVAVAEKLLKGSNPGRIAARVTDPLQKAAQATGNADLAKRAKALLEQAQKASEK